MHTFNAATLLEVSPFYHYNSANYSANPNDYPSRHDRGSGFQLRRAAGWHYRPISRGTPFRPASIALGQHDSYLFGSIFNDGSFENFTTTDSASGGLIEEYISDNYKVDSVAHAYCRPSSVEFRCRHHREHQIDPRVGSCASRFRSSTGCFADSGGSYYQPPPLLTASGPVRRLCERQQHRLRSALWRAR